MATKDDNKKNVEIPGRNKKRRKKNTQTKWEMSIHNDPFDIHATEDIEKESGFGSETW